MYTFLLINLHNYDFQAFPVILLLYRCKVKLNLAVIVIHDIQLYRNMHTGVNNVIYFYKLGTQLIRLVTCSFFSVPEHKTYQTLWNQTYFGARMRSKILFKHKS